MKVKELIEILEMYDSDYEVLVFHEDEETECEINGIGFYQSANKGNTAEEYDYDHVIIAVD